MKNIVTRVILFFFSALSATVLLGAPASFDPVRIEQITGLTGVYNQVSKALTLAGSRIDVKVTVDQGVLPPATGLTYWAAFAPGKRAGQTAIHGELALFSDEVNPIMSVRKNAPSPWLLAAMCGETPATFVSIMTGLPSERTPKRDDEPE